MLANLKRAAFDRETITVGGGEFSPKEVKSFVSAVDGAAASLKDCIESLDYWFKRYGDPEGSNSLMMQQARAALAKLEAQ